jgi:hypothetical protein
MDNRDNDGSDELPFVFSPTSQSPGRVGGLAHLVSLPDYPTGALGPCPRSLPKGGLL